jgi:hypothetical protein
MRDVIRIHTLKENDITESPLIDVVFQSDEALGKLFEEILEEERKEEERKKEEERLKNLPQEEAQTFDVFLQAIEKGN